METCKEISIKYYDTEGNEQVRCVAPVSSDALVHLELMQSHYCKISFTTDTPAYIELGDFIETAFGRFEVIDVVKPKENDSIGYSYEIQFDAYYRKWKNKMLKYRPNTGSAEANFTLTNNIGTHAEIILDNLKYYAAQSKSFLYDPKYEGEGTDFIVSVDDSVDKVADKVISYSSSSILDAIANIAETFDCEWWVEGNIIHFGTCENVNEIVDFKDGDNIVSMSCSQSQSTYANRVYAFGAARNLPSDYKEDTSADVTKYGVVEKRLMLPTESECSDENKVLLESNGFELKNGCIQVKGLTEDQLVEGVTTNDDVYPRNLIKTDKITSYEREVEDESTVEEDDYITRTFYRVNDLTIVNADGEKTGDMAFRSSYKLKGKQLHILFQSGSLNGMDFECEFNPDGKPEILRDDNGEAILKDGNEQINPESQVFEVVGNEDYGRFLPDTDAYPKEGDTFVLYNWDSTKLGTTLVVAASNELLAESIEDLKKTMIDPTTYTCTACSRYSYNDGNGKLHGLGDRVNLYNKGYYQESRQSRIIGYEFHLDLPFDSPKYYVGEKPSYSRLNAMESQIEELVYNGQSYVNNSGTGSSVYIIKSYDKVQPTDYNVYSAKAVDTQRLRKDKADTASGHITFKQGLTADGTVKANQGATFGEYVKSLYAGKGAGIDASGNAEVESLRVRSYMQVMELIVNRLSALEGDQLLTESDTIESVDDLGDSCYGLHLRSKWDGYFTAQTENNVLKGIVNTLAKGSGEYYTAWMRVNSVSTANNYIEVTMYADTDVPSGKNYPPIASMNIARWGNQTDTTRQDCLYFSSTEGRIVKLKGVTKPILDKENYGVTIGTLPDFVSSLTDGDGNPLPIRDGLDYLYVPGIITMDTIRLNKWTGKPVVSYVDRGLWTNGEKYYCEAKNPDTEEYETSDVWYQGCKYRCCKNLTETAPAWNNTDWAMIEGNPAFTVDFEEMESLVDPDNINLTLTIVAMLYNIDVTQDIVDSDVSWTRYSEDADGNERVDSDNVWAAKHQNTGKSLTLTRDDMNMEAYTPKTIRFTATVVLRDGMGNEASTASVSYEY